MAVARWRQMRIWSIETETLNLEIEEHALPTDTSRVSAARAFRDLADHSKPSASSTATKPAMTANSSAPSASSAN